LFKAGGNKMSVDFVELRRDFEIRYSEDLNSMKEEFNNSPAQGKGVKLPKDGTKKSKTLFYLYINRGRIVEKNTLDNLFSPGIDNQNGRHLGRQNGFNILQGRDEHNGERLRTGTYVFVSFNEINNGWNLNRRKIDPNINWDQLKQIYENKCACCGNLEGESCKYDRNKFVVLEKGHMNPNLPLNMENIIPICSYCNRFYKNRVCFNNQGLVTHFKFKRKWLSVWGTFCSDEGINKQTYFFEGSMLPCKT
jgi:hypothetical protein